MNLIKVSRNYDLLKCYELYDYVKLPFCFMWLIKSTFLMRTNFLIITWMHAWIIYIYYV